MIKILKNPFFIYPISFTVVFLLYALGWSNLFPHISTSVFLFFGITFLFYILIGYYMSVKKVIGYMKLDGSVNVTKQLVFVLLGFLLEFKVVGDVPLFSLLNGDLGVGYRDFGIKTFHVILVTYNSFITVVLFHKWLSDKNRKNFLLYVLSMLPGLLIMSRGVFMIGLFSSFFVYIQSNEFNLTLKKIFFFSSLLLGVLYLFGFLGNLRSGHGDSEYVPKQSLATNEFMHSKIPKEFYWTYLYGASPLANFQHNINSTKDVDLDPVGFLLYEGLPMVISKKIKGIVDVEMRKAYLMVHWLTVGTIFSDSYSYIGWYGPVFLSFFLFFFMIIIISMIPKKNPYHVSVIAILSTLVFLNTFDNMLTFDGIFLQFVFPIVITLLSKIKWPQIKLN
jgi:oligosaccharide repeat unit polymerase